MTFRSLGMALILLVCFLAGCSNYSPLTPTPLAPVKTGTLQGVVYLDQLQRVPVVAGALRDGQSPAAGAVVSVRGYPSVSATCDASGAFTMEGVPCGAQTFYVSYPGATRISFTQLIAEGQNIAAPITPGAPARSKWTVLVYMNADNNLEQAAIIDFNEMEAAVPENDPGDVTVLVQLDRSPYYDTSNGNWTDTRRFRVLHDTDPHIINSPALTPALGELDMGNKDTLRDFIVWGQQTAPAEQYLVVLWNHGSGWDPVYDRSVRAVNRAISIDDSSNRTAIRDVELPHALTGIDPINIVAMDACYMSMLEVAYEIRHSADYLIGSEEATPWQGFDYESILTTLFAQGATITPAELATFITADNFRCWKSLNYASSAASAIDLSKMDAVAASLDALSRQLLLAGDMHAVTIRKSWEETKQLGPLGSRTHIRDLGDYAQRLSKNVWDTSIRQHAINLNRDLRLAIHANQSDLPHANGLGIFLPPSWTFNLLGYGTAYGELALAGDTAWAQWLAQSP